MSDFPLVQLLVNSITAGTIYVVAASGMALLFGVAGIFNFAHGEFYMLGAFVVYYVCSVLGVSYYAALVLSMVIVGILGLGTERVFFRRLRGKTTGSMLMSFGLALLVGGGAALWFGTTYRGIRGPLPGVVSFLDSSISKERLLVVVIGVLVVASLYSFVKFTRLGRAIQAIGEDTETASIMGVDVDRISGLTFAISTALAAAAGALVGPIFSVSPFMGQDVIIKILVVLVLGGMGSIQGAMVGGMFVGFLETFSTYFLGTAGYLPTFLFMMVILVVRPSGLLGSKNR